MPELPEVETVKETLKKMVLHKTFMNVRVYYDGIIEYPSKEEFIKQIIGQEILDIKRRGKWLVFELNDYCLLSHLRMEGKYNIRKIGDRLDIHEHVCFEFTDGTELRYRDTRKFGKMHLLRHDELLTRKPLCELGLEPWDEKLSTVYLKNSFSNKKTPIKTVILDQSIIVGIGNIYADEILFLSKINPYARACDLNDDQLNSIILNTRKILKEAIKMGGTTIRTYTSSEGVHGKFQQNLLVHNHEGKNCPSCSTTIIKVQINGRGTYYCTNCQK